MGECCQSERTTGPRKRFVRQQVPEEVRNDPELAKAASVLPSNYDFEVAKTVWRVRSQRAKVVVLQLPEGLLMYGCALADIVKAFGKAEECFIIGDPTYGACCIDDFTAEALRADLLVHYGHSCLVPVSETRVPCLYIFVTIRFEATHMVESLRATFRRGSRLAVAGTIQFVHSVHGLKEWLSEEFSVHVPQSKPLSPGEVLGCTAPSVPPSTDAIVFIADGRFHLEAMMVANPRVPVYRYDPSTRKLTKEGYDHHGMRSARRDAIEAAKSATVWGIVLGTLGRQGNTGIVARLKELLEQRGCECTTVLMAELSPKRLERMAASGISAFVQVACPRLSIDWGESFALPVLTPYEAFAAMGAAEPFYDGDSGASGLLGHYPMDYYAADAGPWGSCHIRRRRRPIDQDQQLSGSGTEAPAR